MTPVSYSSGDEGSCGARDCVVQGLRDARIAWCEDRVVRGLHGARIVWCEDRVARGIVWCEGSRGARVWGAIRVNTPVFGNVYQTCDLY